MQASPEAAKGAPASDGGARDRAAVTGSLSMSSTSLLSTKEGASPPLSTNDGDSPLITRTEPAASRRGSTASLGSMRGAVASGGECCQKAGYLYKKSSATAVMRSSWSRRFFTLHDNVLEYFSATDGRRHGKGQPGRTIAIDLRLCSVRPSEHAERRHCFEILSPIKYAKEPAPYSAFHSASPSACHTAGGNMGTASPSLGDTRCRVRATPM